MARPPAAAAAMPLELAQIKPERLPCVIALPFRIMRTMRTGRDLNLSKSTTSSPERSAGPQGRRHRISGKFIAWIAVIAAVVVIGFPTALLFGAGDLIFDSPREGVITFFGTLVLVAVILAVGFVWEQIKGKSPRRRGHK